MLGKAEKKTMEFTKDMGTVEVQNFDFKVPAGCLCLAKMSLKFMIAGKTGWQEVVRKTMNPSCIIGAFITPGVYEQDSRKRWIQIVKFE
ncbi:MAG: hypothetical protein ABWY16_20030, partial [Pedobacter sp.]|uniref:hypothetical protein n=1 Tax=Pedobacter sp. TaxID=1411316 RepID=UPI003398FEF2